MQDRFFLPVTTYFTGIAAFSPQKPVFHGYKARLHAGVMMLR